MIALTAVVVRLVDRSLDGEAARGLCTETNHRCAVRFRLARTAIPVVFLLLRCFTCLSCVDERRYSDQPQRRVRVVVAQTLLRAVSA